MHDYLDPKPTVCAVCGTTFDASLINRGKGIHLYCSKKCRTRADNQKAYARRKSTEPLPELNKACVICGIQFIADKHHPNALTCSVKCNEARMNQLRRDQTAKKVEAIEPRPCEECGTAFTPSIFVAHKQKYCSSKCANRVLHRQEQHRREPGHNKRLVTARWKDAAAVATYLAGGKCQSCQEEAIGDRRLSVHHKFHLTEGERNDHTQENLIVLCGSCHHLMHDIKLGRGPNGSVLISGLVFKLLGIKEVQVVDAGSESDSP